MKTLHKLTNTNTPSPSVFAWTPPGQCQSCTCFVLTVFCIYPTLYFHRSGRGREEVGEEPTASNGFDMALYIGKVHANVCCIGH